MSDYYSILGPVLRTLPPEAAHELTIDMLARGIVPHAPANLFPALAIDVAGLHFANPIGMAAGFDKNARAVSGVLRMGFGFTEAGTVTPKAQSGNPRPRLFRLTKEQAVINRLGFNNDGADVFIQNLTAQGRPPGIVGINIGKNKDTLDAAEDYVLLLNKMYGLSDYITVNISSPNTAGLRDLQQGDAFRSLLERLMKERSRLASEHGQTIPLFVKLAPDLSADELAAAAEVVLDQKPDAVILGNTTISRPEVQQNKLANEQGGLSGRPLFNLSTRVLGDFYRLTKGQIPLIGVGGISSAEDAFAKIQHGASLIQLYTAMIYQGPGLVQKMAKGLNQLLLQNGFKNLKEAIGSK